MKYVKGHFYTERFGEYGCGIDQFGFSLIGDINHPIAQFETAPVLADHQKVFVWFRFAKLKPYGTVVRLLNKLTIELKVAGWKVAETGDIFPETVSSIDDLVDTREMRFLGKPEADFPNKPNIEGYNAAIGFTVVVEKLGTKPEFTEGEIQEIRRIAKEFGRNIYGRELEEVKS